MGYKDRPPIGCGLVIHWCRWTGNILLAAAVDTSWPTPTRIGRLSQSRLAEECAVQVEQFTLDPCSLVFRGYAAGWSWVSSTSGNRSRVCWWG